MNAFELIDNIPSTQHFVVYEDNFSTLMNTSVFKLQVQYPDSWLECLKPFLKYEVKNIRALVRECHDGIKRPVIMIQVRKKVK